MCNKQKFREFCNYHNNLPIFLKDWWLDAVCNKNWDIAIVEQNNEIIAFMPYYLTNNMLYSVIKMPKLTQTMGPYIIYPPKQDYQSKLSYEKKVMNSLIQKLPKFDYFSQNFNYSMQNWLPFYWKKFKQTTFYTYVIEDLNDTKKIFNQFNYSKKKNINKAKNEIVIKNNMGFREFYNFHKFTLEKNNEKISYDFNLLNRICIAGYKNKSAKIFAAYDKTNNLHSAYLLIWDAESAYLLISAIDPDYKSLGSSSLLIYEMICFASTVTKKFDFEGSMISSVESSFRKFGAIQKPYFHVYKSSRSYKLLQLLKKAIN